MKLNIYITMLKYKNSECKNMIETLVGANQLKTSNFKDYNDVYIYLDLIV